jgi:integrase
MLTDQAIRRLKPTTRDYWRADSESDGTVNNLYLRVRVNGAKVWHVRRMKDGSLLNRRLGSWPAMSLKSARQTARNVLSGAIEGDASLKSVADEWYSRRIEHDYKRPKQIRQYLDRISPALLVQPIHTIERLTVARFLQRYAEDRGPVGANRLLAILKQLFGYAAKVGYLPENILAPLTRDEVGGQEPARARVLTDDEIRTLWTAKSGNVPLLKFLLLTAQRIGEAQLAEWKDIDGDVWRIPAEHSKNGKAHWVTISPQARAILEARKDDDGRIFGNTTNTNVQAWLRRWQKADANAWTPHDLRRTAATRMNDLGVAPHVVEKILNHSLQGVMAVYNKAEYADERANAMRLWGVEVARIVRKRP